MSTRMIGIHIAKNSFQLHGVDDKGKAVLKKQLSHEKLAAFMGNLTPCTIAVVWWGKLLGKGIHAQWSHGETDQSTVRKTVC